MFRFIRNIGCLIIIIVIAFFIVALFFGGEKIRQMGDKTTGIVKKGFHYAADKADEIHQNILQEIDEFLSLFYTKGDSNNNKRDINNKKP